MNGLHLTADLYQCACDDQIMSQAGKLSEMCRLRTQQAGLTVVGEQWHEFPGQNAEPGGVTGMLLLAESHVALHTWPERSGVTLDVYVCNVTADNSDKAEQLMNELIAVFKPANSQLQRIQRGDLSSSQPDSSEELLFESFHGTSLYGFRFNRRIETRRSPYQTIDVMESSELGRTLCLDGHFMTSEADEFFYHEAMTHPAAIAHPSPRRALVVGGGDGGSLEELLKHSSIEEILLVEIDAEVVDVARHHLQTIHRGAFDDPRVTLHFGDGAQFLSETRDRFDLILLDLTDPETLAGPLYTPAFFKNCKRALAPGGAMTLHIGSPFYEPDKVRKLVADLKATFAQVHCFGLHVPLYGSYWGFAVVSDKLLPAQLEPAKVQDRLDARGVEDLQYYNAEVHRALFALPDYYQALIRH